MEGLAGVGRQSVTCRSEAQVPLRFSQGVVGCGLGA